jgi:hypothetical protein
MRFFTMRGPRRPSRACASLLSLGALSAVLLSGCGGGSSQSVISNGFPADGSSHSLVVPGIASNDSLTLTSPSTLGTPVSFSPPAALSDSTVTTTAEDKVPVASGTATYVKGTAYQFPAAISFAPSNVTLTIQYEFANLSGADTASLNIYYHDNSSTTPVWKPVIPTSGGFSNLPILVTQADGTTKKVYQVTTTITGISQTPTAPFTYAVLSAQPPMMPPAL